MDPTYKAPGIASGLDKIGEFREAVFIDGEQDLNARKVTVVTNANLKAGTVLGEIQTDESEPVATATGGNTGNGTFGTILPLVGIMPGTYTVRFVTSSTNGGKFDLIRPDGIAAGSGNVGVLFAGGGLRFTISDGSTDFAVGDSFTIAVTAGAGMFRTSLAASNDGSNVPSAILAHDIVYDGVETEYEAVIYESGRFLADQLTYGTGHTAASVRAALRDVNITLRM